METRARSMAKALTWRTGALIVTVSVGWIVTGNPFVAVSIGLVDTGAKLVAFYFHERLWLRVRFGRPPLPGGEI